MAGKVLDTQEIHRLIRSGWTNAQIAKYMNVSTVSIAVSQHERLSWRDDPTLRERWSQRMPRLKVQIKQIVAATAPASNLKSET